MWTDVITSLQILPSLRLSTLLEFPVLCSHTQSRDLHPLCFQEHPQARPGQTEYLYPPHSWNYPVVKRVGEPQSIMRLFHTKFLPRIGRGASNPTGTGMFKAGDGSAAAWGLLCRNWRRTWLYSHKTFKGFGFPQPSWSCPSPRDLHELGFESCLSTLPLS